MAEPRRAVVLSGGGAKGIFESGVVHALAQTGYEADVITGSSVGALNALGYAEIVRARRQDGAETALPVADSLLTLWQEIDRLKVADVDGTWGWRLYALAGLLLVLGAALVWAVVSVGRIPTWLSVLELTAGIVIGAAVLAAALALFVAWTILPARLRDHVWNGRGAEPEKKDRESHSLGAQVVELALRLGGFLPSLFSDRGLRRAIQCIVPVHRRLSEYRKAGLDVRLTRTNVRTGRTEISEFLEPRDMDRPGFDRGLRVIGDPRATEAALASSAFPGAFPAVPADSVYVAEENRSLYARVRDRVLAKKELKKVFGQDESKKQYMWLMALLERLSEEDRSLTLTGSEARLLERLRSEFYGARAAWNRVPVRSLFLLAETRGWPQIPLAGEDDAEYADRYIDGGILDNTPLSTALTALREADTEDRAQEDTAAQTHEMLVVLLSPRARSRYLGREQAARLQGPALGTRALRLQAEGRVEDDLRTAMKIDRLLAEKGLLEERVEQAAALGGASVSVAAAPPAGSWADVFSREGGGGNGEEEPLQVEEERLVRVDVTRVYPSWDLPWLFSLDDRLGFDARHARAFQVRGCRDTLVALTARHAEKARTGGAVPPGARRAIQLTGNVGAQVPAGWICPAERCSLRAACDQVAAEERKVAASA